MNLNTETIILIAVVLIAIHVTIFVKNSEKFALTKNGRCGIINNVETHCPVGECCSRFGKCGGEKGQHSAFCSAKDNVGTNDGKYDGDFPVSKNRQCGPKNGHKCPNGQCCNRYGWCGSKNEKASITDIINKKIFGHKGISKWCDAGTHGGFGGMYDGK